MGLFDWVQKSWAFNFKFVALSIIFWLIMLAHEYYLGVPATVPAEYLALLANTAPIIRSFSFAGTIFISIALLCSVAFKFRPLLSKYAFVRKNFGVMGFIFIVFHVLSAIHFYFNWDIPSIYTSLNPFENAIVFGTLAFPILFVMAITSINWVEHKIGGTIWKALHRLVYFAYLFMIFHALKQNPPALESIPGYVLKVLFAAVLLGELYWWYMISKQRGFKNHGFYIGLLLILLYIVIGYFAFFAN